MTDAVTHETDTDMSASAFQQFADSEEGQAALAPDAEESVDVPVQDNVPEPQTDAQAEPEWDGVHRFTGKVAGEERVWEIQDADLRNPESEAYREMVAAFQIKEDYQRPGGAVDQAAERKAAEMAQRAQLEWAESNGFVQRNAVTGQYERTAAYDKWEALRQEKAEPERHVSQPAAPQYTPEQMSELQMRATNGDATALQTLIAQAVDARTQDLVPRSYVDEQIQADRQQRKLAEAQARINETLDKTFDHYKDALATVPDTLRQHYRKVAGEAIWDAHRNGSQTPLDAGVAVVAQVADSYLSRERAALDRLRNETAASRQTVPSRIAGGPPAPQPGPAPGMDDTDLDAQFAAWARSQGF